MNYGLYSLDESQTPRSFEIRDDDDVFRLYLIDQKGKKHLCFRSSSQKMIFRAKLLVEKITEYGLVNEADDWQELFDAEDQLEQKREKETEERPRKRRAKSAFGEETPSSSRRSGFDRDSTLDKGPGGCVFRVPTPPPFPGKKIPVSNQRKSIPDSFWWKKKPTSFTHEKPRFTFGQPAPSPQKKKFSFSFAAQPSKGSVFAPKRHSREEEEITVGHQKKPFRFSDYFNNNNQRDYYSD